MLVLQTDLKECGCGGLPDDGAQAKSYKVNFSLLAVLESEVAKF